MDPVPVLPYEPAYMTRAGRFPYASLLAFCISLWPWAGLRNLVPLPPVSEVRAIAWVLDHDISGPVNLVGPAPVTNADFSRALGRALHRPALLPVPKAALGVLLGREFADELLFSSQRVTPEVLLRSGFTFEHQTVDAALAAALGKAGGR